MVSHQTAHRVRWGEADPAGIVYYPRFLEWFDEASDELFRALGLPWERFFPEQGITGLPILEVHCRFTAPLRYGDDLRIVSTIAEVRDKTLRIEHVVKHGETTCATGYEVRAWAVPAEDGALRARPIPEAVAARLRGEVEPSAVTRKEPQPWARSHGST